MKKKYRKRKIDKVTTDRFHTVLKMCGISIPLDLIDNIIDIVELIEDRGGKTSFQDCCISATSFKEPGHNFVD